MLKTVLFVHVLGTLGFFAAHGVSIAVALWVSKVREPARLSVALELSRYALPVSNGALALLLLSGVAGGFLGNWWGSGWIWASLVLFLSFALFMGGHFGPRFRDLRTLVCQFETQRQERDETPIDAETFSRLDAAIRRMRLPAVTCVGIAWSIAIVSLMVFRPL